MKDVFIRIDSFLIDRVFQPISDRLARIASCYAIAAFLLTGALPLNFIIGWITEFWPSVILAVLWMPYLIYRAYKLESSSISEVQPTDRFEHIHMRMFLLVVQTLGSPWDILFLYAGNYLDFLDTCSWWLIICAMYFMACRRNPPKPKAMFVTA